VSLYELVRAFSVFPRDGVYLPLTWEIASAAQEAAQIASQEESSMEQPIQSRVYSSDTARLICSFLSDSGARVLAFGSARNFRTPFPSIFKTGTANQFQSIVALAATPKYTAGVWMGNFTGETVIGRTGSSIPAAIARDALVFLQGRYGAAGWAQNSPDFPEPENWHTVRICALSGMAPTDACPSVINEYVQPGSTLLACNWHRNINGRSEVIYPAEYQAWFTSASRQGALDHGSRPLEITSPRSGFVYLSSPGIGRDEIPVEVIGGEEEELRVSFNDRSFSVSRPFVFYLERTPGLHILRVQNGAEESTITFTVE
jgi:penicillin-binding protein 1C